MNADLGRVLARSELASSSKSWLPDLVVVSHGHSDDQSLIAQASPGTGAGSCRAECARRSGFLWLVPGRSPAITKQVQ